VFSEASAFGIPSITTDTGGISSAVENGVNGILLNVNSDEIEFAEKIYELYNNKEMFRKIRISSRKAYEERLSWKIWTQNFNKSIQSLTKNVKE
jgi:glycosyltransferase involved in cell wall biosynthesis